MFLLNLVFFEFFFVFLVVFGTVSFDGTDLGETCRSWSYELWLISERLGHSYFGILLILACFSVHQ